MNKNKDKNNKMTNTTLEQKIEGSKRLLIVEDTPRYAINAVKAAKARGYQIDVAFDLEDALDYMGKNLYSGIITDMCFQQSGVITDFRDALTGDDFQYLTKTLEINDSFERAKMKQAKTDSSLRSEVISKTQEILDEGLFTAMNRKLVYNPNTLDSFKRSISRDNSSIGGDPSPALGYYIIKKSQETNTPVVVSTIARHAEHSVPAILATGLLTKEELIRQLEVKQIKCNARGFNGKFEEYLTEGYASTLNDKIKNLDSLKRVFYDVAGSSANLASIAEDTEDETNFSAMIHARLFSLGLDREMPLILNQVVVSGFRSEKGKTPRIYEFSIDQLENKIEQTRPYRSLAKGEELTAFSKEIMIREEIISKEQK